MGETFSILAFPTNHFAFIITQPGTEQGECKAPFDLHLPQHTHTQCTVDISSTADDMDINGG